jgi:flagellar biosynthetic protein FlhB
MAEQNEGQEKNEQPTPKRLDDARKKGQIARSRELSTTLILIGGALALAMSGAQLMHGLGGIMRANFNIRHADIFRDGLVVERFIEHVLLGLSALGPVLAMAVVIAIAAPLALGGWNMSVSALAPKFERIDPIKGLKCVFGPKGLVELLKALAKCFLVLGFSIVALHMQRETIFGLARGDIASGLSETAGVLLFTFIVASSATIVVTLIDVPFQLWQHDKQLRMSRQEVKDEMKETDGSPETKSRVRGMQQELARRCIMEEVPKADVVIVNPEHFAVALKFDPESMRAPIVVAKGVEETAANIRAVADSHGVMIMSAPPLARAIYHTTKLNREIPAGLYVAVARVLAYVFQLRDGARNPVEPEDLPIPGEYVY